MIDVMVKKEFPYLKKNYAAEMLNIMVLAMIVVLVELELSVTMKTKIIIKNVRILIVQILMNIIIIFKVVVHLI